ncbi:MAG: hypothetical protein IJ799_00115 [Bacteroidales bacterium]|nr:hypothetical protein [Bacteroidales bacterium]
MKKFFAFAMTAAIAAACTLDKIQPEDNTSASAEVTVFTGAMQTPSRVSVGDKVGSVYKALWETGDVLTVIDASTSTELGTATLTAGAGQNIGTFSFPGGIADGTSVILKYGTAGVATEQTQSGAGASSLAACTSASSTAVEVNGGKANFTLVHDPAIVKVSVASSAYSGATVSQVILRCAGGVVSGTDKDYVRVTLTTPLTLGTTAQDVWMTANASDLSGKEIDVAFVVTNSGGTFTLPVGFAGAALEANKVNSFTVSALSDEKCVPWYEPHDTRLMAGEGYAYGDANCYLIQCKSSVFSGATLAPVSSIPDEVAIKYAVRGDFLKVVPPKDVTFEWAKMANGNLYQPRHNGTFVSDGFTFTQDAANFKVTVKNNTATGGAPMLIMKKDGKILWGWAFWNIAADGTELQPVTIGTHKLANLNIGEATTDLAKWVSGGRMQVMTNYYYQWGRYLPSVYWQSYWSCGFLASAEGQTQVTNTTGNVPVTNGPFATLKEALEYPYGGITHYNSAAESETVNLWCSELTGDLWGGAVGKKEQAGTKSNYDPCPKGWRVPDYTAMTDILAESGETPAAEKYETATGKAGLHIGSMFLTHTGYIDFKRVAKNSETDYRPTNNGTAGSFSSTFSAYWSNYAASHSASSPYIYRYYKSGGAKAAVAQQIRNSACPVRCQKDDDNR